MSFIKRHNGVGIMSEVVVRQSELEKLRDGDVVKNVGFIVAVKERLNQLQSTRTYYESYVSTEYQNKLVRITQHCNYHRFVC